jgi:pimeloyl-ACP methyl ester carboxylesterase
MIRLLFKTVGWLLVLAIVIVVGFRLAAMMREEQTASAAEGPGVRFVEVAGLDLHFREWGPADGPPLLLVPGTMAWSETFRDIAAPLGQQGFRVIALDLPPFGYSDRPASGDYSRKAQAARILGFADAMKLDRFALGVHSYGGGAAMEAAFTAPERIAAMVLLDVALGLDATGGGPPLAPIRSIPMLREAVVSLTFANPLTTGFGLRDFIHDDSLVTPERIEIYTRPLTIKGTTPAIGHWLMTGLFGDESGSRAADRASYRAFDRPVLVIWGAEDTVTPPAQGEEIAALLPNSELAMLPGVNHIPQVEAPEEVVRLIGEFLRRQSGKGDRLSVLESLRGAIVHDR